MATATSATSLEKPSVQRVFSARSHTSAGWDLPLGRRLLEFRRIKNGGPFAACRVRLVDGLATEPLQGKRCFW